MLCNFKWLRIAKNDSRCGWRQIFCRPPFLFDSSYDLPQIQLVSGFNKIFNYCLHLLFCLKMRFTHISGNIAAMQIAKETLRGCLIVSLNFGIVIVLIILTVPSLFLKFDRDPSSPSASRLVSVIQRSAKLLTFTSLTPQANKFSLFC